MVKRIRSQDEPSSRPSYFQPISNNDYNTVVSDEGSNSTFSNTSDYVRTEAVTFFHSLPRAGYTKDISALASSNSNEVQSYFYGCLFITIITCSLFVLWSIALLILQQMGKTKVGFLSGQQPTSETDEKCCKRIFILRTSFIVSSFLLIVCSILFMVYGSLKADESNKLLQSSSRQVVATLGELNDIIAKSSDVHHNTTTVIEYLANDTAQFCPQITNISSLLKPKLNTTELIAGITYFNTSLNSLPNMQESAEYVYTRAKKVDDFIDFYASNNWIMPVIVTLCTVCASFFITSSIFRMMGKNEGFFDCLVEMIILPLFVVLVVIVWFMILALGVAIFMDSDMCFEFVCGMCLIHVLLDFCSGGQSMSPDGTVKAILQRYDITESSLRYEFIDSVLRGCQPESSHPSVQIYIDEFKMHQLNINDFLGVIQSIGTPKLNHICSRSETEYINTLKILKQNTQSLMEYSMEALSLFECLPYYELYYTTVEQTACKNVVDEYGTMYFYLIAIEFCAFFMLTLRVSLRKKISEDKIRLQSSGRNVSVRWSDLGMSDDVMSQNSKRSVWRYGKEEVNGMILEYNQRRRSSLSLGKVEEMDDASQYSNRRSVRFSGEHEIKVSEYDERKRSVDSSEYSQSSFMSEPEEGDVVDVIPERRRSSVKLSEVEEVNDMTTHRIERRHSSVSLSYNRNDVIPERRLSSVSQVEQVENMTTHHIERRRSSVKLSEVQEAPTQYPERRRSIGSYSLKENNSSTQYSERRLSLGQSEVEETPAQYPERRRSIGSYSLKENNISTQYSERRLSLGKSEVEETPAQYPERRRSIGGDNLKEEINISTQYSERLSLGQFNSQENNATARRPQMSRRNSMY